LVKKLKMVYLFGKNLNNKSLALYNIAKLYGLGFFLVKLMFNDLCIGFNARMKELNQNLLVKIIKWVEKNKVFIENLLLNKLASSINRLKILKSFRGLKHSYRIYLKNSYVSKKV